MAELKTTRNDASVPAFLDSVENNTRRADGYTLLQMMREVSGQEPAMWGPTIVGFGQYHYKYATGHEGDAMQMGFSPRKANLVLYLDRFDDYDDLLARLGKHKTSVACLYINKLADVDQDVLRQLIARSWANATTSAA